ncbi:hypothetical protein HWV62_31730 [Athelia sp. TMB]|nr:hypothetical protein HWV62_31730 [Athelia sp. TMB]
MSGANNFFASTTTASASYPVSFHQFAHIRAIEFTGERSKMAILPLPDSRTTADVYRHANAMHGEIERFHFLLREWKQRVALHPAPDAHSPESSFPDGIVPLLFTVIEQALPCVRRGNTIDPPLISAWPKMWPWLKFYAEHARRRRHKCNLLGKFAPEMNWLVHDLVMDTVRVFTIHGHSPPNKLFEVFVSTPGLQSLLAAMWIDEVRDSRSLRDLRGCILPRALSSEAGSLLAQEIIDAYGGSAEEAAKLIPKRIRLALRQESPHLDHLTNEFGVLDKHRNNKLSPFNPYLSPLPKSYLRLARDVILWLLELPPSEEERSKLACVCFTLIIAVITESPNYSCALDVLSHEIPALLYKASFLCSRGTNSEIFHQETRLILNQFLPRFLTHRPMLDLAREASRVLTRPPKRKHTALFTAHIKYFTDAVDLMWGRYLSPSDSDLRFYGNAMLSDLVLNMHQYNRAALQPFRLPLLVFNYESKFPDQPHDAYGVDIALVDVASAAVPVYAQPRHARVRREWCAALAERDARPAWTTFPLSLVMSHGPAAPRRQVMTALLSVYTAGEAYKGLAVGADDSWDAATRPRIKWIQYAFERG